MAELEAVLHFLDDAFDIASFPDYPHALNGLQVEGPKTLERIGAAVDASEQSILEAVQRGLDLLIVHHGLFWDGLGPLTGPRYRKVAALLSGPTALFSLHLPLDAHPEMGNCVGLARALQLEPKGTFAQVHGVEIGWWAECALPREVLSRRLREVLGGEVHVVPGGGAEIEKVGILTGSGTSALQEVTELGLDALITGEAPHHAYHHAMELGVNLFLGGHYATETFGVKALAQHLAERFSLEWEFLDFPTGL